MSSNENIQRLREKRKELEANYSHSPKRKGNEAIDISASGNTMPDPGTNVNEGGNVRSGRYARTSHIGIETSNSRSSTTSAPFSTSVLEHISFLEMKVKDLEGLEARLKSIEDKAVVKDDAPKYPTDSYSLIAMNGPKPTLLWYELWSTQRSFYFFLFGMLVFMFQIALYGTMLFGETDTRWGTVPDSGNPDSDENFFAALIPPNTNGYVKAAQIVSLLVYIVFPDSTLQDLLGAYRFFPRCSCSNKDDDPVWMMRFACLLKGSQALFGIATVWLLVMTSESVLEIILNFTAVNFISNIDDRAYSLASDGVFGRFLKEEVSENIGSTNLPASMQRKNDGGYCIVLTSAGVLMIGFLIAMMGAQDSPNRWLTQYPQITFTDEGFTSYSGCYALDSESENFNRYTYHGPEASLSYCGKDRKWYLLGDTGGYTVSDPCEAWNDIGIASSSETSSFDVSGSFSDTWTSSFGKPLSIKFDESCQISESVDTSSASVGVAGDSICDVDLNVPDSGYDGGDCCAATCEGPLCGKKVLASAFGNANATIVAGFPHCKDPDVNRRLTLQLNGMGSSRRLLDASNADFVNETPATTYFSLNCDGKDVLTGYIDESMANNSETVMVKDGASCALELRNSLAGSGIEIDTNVEVPDPSWYVDYTLFHGDNNNDNVEILNEHVDREGSRSFNLIPDCYFEKLENEIDAGTIYNTDSGSSSKAIAWLIQDDESVSQCGEEDFIERYALVKMNFAMNGSVDFINREDHCGWPSISCTGGNIDAISLGYEGLNGEIPSEISILSNLERLDLAGNGLSDITTGIGSLTRLQTLYLHGNQLSSIPTEIGLMSGLKTLALNGNELASIPTEIGLLTGLQQLLLFDNTPLLSIPEEVKVLSRSGDLKLYGNDFSCNSNNIPGDIAAFCFYSL